MAASINASLADIPQQVFNLLSAAAMQTPAYILLLFFVALIALGLGVIFITLHLVAPKPRAPFPSEKTYRTTNPDGTLSSPRPLPCWYDRWRAEAQTTLSSSSPPSSYPTIPAGFPVPEDAGLLIEPAEVAISVVIPAYNEAERIIPTLEEMVAYLDENFGRKGGVPVGGGKSNNGNSRPGSAGSGGRNYQHHRLVFNKRSLSRQGSRNRGGEKEGEAKGEEQSIGGYEIIVVDDGSRDRTAEIALEFSRRHGLHDILRVVRLEKNRGKGGSVTHGMRHVRGEYAVFADADGASRFSDLGRLIEGCEDVVDGSNRGVAIGSRAHLVGSEVVVKRSAIRNLLMRSFHFVLMILTPPATSRIRDTQCGFKLFSRAALPHIIPYMHSEGWIFDIEMLMLAESAPATPVLSSDGSVIGTSYGIKVAEVPVVWHEVDGSKMNLVQDSIKMAIGLAVLRASWMMGVYRRRLT